MPDNNDENSEFALWDRDRLIEEIKATRRAAAGIAEGDPDNHIAVESMVSHRNEQPYVLLVVNKVRAQLTIPKAKEIGFWMLRAASTAEADAYLSQFIGKEVGLAPDQRVGLLRMFRDFCKANAVEQAKED